MQLRYEQTFERLGMTGYRYGILLVTILTSLIFQLAAPEADWARLVTILLQGVTLLMALVASRVHPWILRVATVAVCLVGRRIDRGPDRIRPARAHRGPPAHGADGGAWLRSRSRAGYSSTSRSTA